MTTARKLITDAFREGNLIPIGTVPTDKEFAEALVRLNRYIGGVYGQELGENLLDWVSPAPQRTAPVAANYPQLPYPTSTDISILSFPQSSDASLNVTPFPPKNSRIVWGGVTMTVWFPEAPDPGTRMAVVAGSGAGDGGSPTAVLTLDGNGRLINDGPQVQISAPLSPQQWLYRDDIAKWVTVADLELDDECPFPEEFDDLWVVMLFLRLAPRYGKTTAPETQMTAAKMLTKLKAKYRQSQDTVYKSYDYPRSAQSYLPAGTWFW